MISAVLRRAETPPAAPFRKLAAIFAVMLGSLTVLAESSFKTPVSYEDADQRAGDLLARMTAEEKLQLITGYRSFCIRGFPRLGIPEIYLENATQGVRLRKDMGSPLDKSTAFPCPLSLAATWDPDLAYRYARSVGEEGRVRGVGLLLGPGANIYRVSQCGRNFEYFGEDPFLAARIIERYVRGVLDTGTIPTLKHFIGNETDYRRRATNSVIDERTLHEIYLPGFKAGIDAGAMAVMTAYNQFNDEWCGQSHELITNILRGELGYKWLVMTDWVSVWDARKVIRSGQDLEMPGKRVLEADAARLLKVGQVSVGEIDRMARSILRTCIAMGLHDRPANDVSYLAKFPEHVQCALQTAREGIVLLKNNGILPLPKNAPGHILVTGLYVDTLARGGGSANVEGYDIVSLMSALQTTYGDRIEYVKTPTDEQLKSASAIVLSTGTPDIEGADRPFTLPAAEEQRVVHTVSLNPRTIVIVNSGGGIGMTAWNDQAAAVVHAWYPGQIGNRALAEILCGDTNPSGKLPITIERCFEDSPGYGYIPADAQFYTPSGRDETTHPINRIEYKEGVFVGYRWYEAKKIAPLYAFGHGLSYTTFQYSKIGVSPQNVGQGGRLTVTFTVTNTGKVAGSEIAQLYVHPANSRVTRPEKELKGFKRVSLAPGESCAVDLVLTTQDFAYWNVGEHTWKAEPGEYELLVGGASDRIVLQDKVILR